MPPPTMATVTACARGVVRGGEDRGRSTGAAVLRMVFEGGERRRRSAERRGPGRGRGRPPAAWRFEPSPRSVGSQQARHRPLLTWSSPPPPATPSSPRAKSSAWASMPRVSTNRGAPSRRMFFGGEPLRMESARNGYTFLASSEMAGWWSGAGGEWAFVQVGTQRTPKGAALVSPEMRDNRPNRDEVRGQHNNLRSCGRQRVRSGGAGRSGGGARGGAGREGGT